MASDFAAEDDRDFVGLADPSVGVQQMFAEFIEGGAPLKDQIVTVFGLCEEQAVLATGLTPFFIAKERRERRQPLLAAGASRSLAVRESASS